MVIALKAVHISALMIWCAGLLALPLMLKHLEPEQGQVTYGKLRLITHYAYTHVVTPAALIAVAAGIGLIFAEEVFEAWLIAKLAAVGLLACVHGFEGHVVLKAGEKKGNYDTPGAAWMIVPALSVMSLILLLVLSKPVIPPDVFPEWLTTPRGNQLPFPEVPS